MPELPEVQTTVDGIKKVVVGSVITDVWTDYNSPYYKGSEQIKDPTYFTFFRKELLGKQIIGSSRRAKNVLIHVEGGLTILIHMKMTGHIMHGTFAFDAKKKKDKWSPLDEGPLQDPFNKFLHLVFSLSSGKSLVLSDMRKFAKVTLVKTADMNSTIHFKDLGPEPLSKEFTLKVFMETINKKPKGKIKTVLMDQSLIAGIGNIYSDEVLWRAGVHPEELVSNIPHPLFKKMFDAIKTTLNKGIDFGGDSMSDYRNIYGEPGKFQEQHQAYRQTKKSCKKPKCKGIILRKMVGGRSAHFCSAHQLLQK